MQYGQQMEIYANALAAERHSNLDTSFVERFYRDFYTSINCNDAVCFKDSATLSFIKNENNGKRYPLSGSNNSDSSSIVHALPVALRYAGSSHMLDKVAMAVRVVQLNDMAVAQAQAAAHIIELVRYVAMVDQRRV